MDSKILFELNALAELMYCQIYYYDKQKKEIQVLASQNTEQERLVWEVVDALIQADTILDKPLIYHDYKDIYFSIVETMTDYIIVGPVCVGVVDFSKRWEYYHIHNIDPKQEVCFSKMNFKQFIHLLILISHIVAGNAYTYEDIILANKQIQKEQEEKIDVKLNEKELEHHTYRLEREWADAMRAGDREKAKKVFYSINGSEGKLSKDIVTHTKYMYVAIITIATRISLEAGLSPIMAYGLSDKLINKIDKCKSVADVNAMYMEAMDAFLDMIKETQNRKKYSNYLEQCKQYIEQNYKEKLSLDTLAEYMGLNATYLSHIFSQEEKITIQEYINKVRVERAQNLLKFSDKSILEISDYVGFQSQSYFGKIFKKYSGLTPGKYRAQFHIKEFRKEE